VIVISLLLAMLHHLITSVHSCIMRRRRMDWEAPPVMPLTLMLLPLVMDMIKPPHTVDSLMVHMMH